MAYIYSITNLENQKIYVGKTTQPNPYDRWKQHLQLARNKDNLNETNSAHSMPIVRAISKYGADQFKFRVLEECLDDKVNERETYWIERLNSCGKNGYNITLGGEGIKKPRQYWANHPHSKAVSCYTLEGEWVRDYDTAGIAADTLGNKKAKNCISACIKGITFQALGYRWALKGEQPKLIQKRVNRRGAVYGIHLDTGRKKVWKSMADAAADVEGNRTSNNAIHKSLKSPNKAKFLKVYFFMALLVRVKLFWHALLPVKLKFRFTQFQVRILLKCLLVLVQREYAIALHKRIQMLLQSSSLTKLTQ